MTRRRRTLALNSMLAVVVVAGGVGTYLLVSGRSAGAAPATTRTVEARAMDVSSTVTASGTLEAVKEVAANFGTSGTVTSVKVAVGDTVDKGDVLATLDKSDARSQVSLAEANLASAQASLTKAEDGTTVTTTNPKTGKTKEKTTVDASQVASAKAQVQQSQSSLDDAEQALADTVLKAPISGTVMSVNGIVGSSVSAGGSGSAGSSTAETSSTSDFVTIAKLTSMQVGVSFSESDIGSVTVGQAAAITFPAVAGVTATGKVVSIDPNPTTSNSVVSYGAVVRLASVPKTVRLGQSADVVITTAEAKNVVAVPTLAITTLGDRSIVRVVKDGVVTPTEVETGIASTSYTEITSGLTAGESVELDLSSSSSTTGTTTGGGTGRTGGSGRDGGGFSVGG